VEGWSRDLIAFNKLDLVLRRRPVLTDRIDVIEELHAVQHQLQTLAQDIDCPGKHALQGSVCQHDAIRRVNDEHGFLQTSEGGLQLGQLAGAQLLEPVGLLDQLIASIAEIIPVRATGAGQILPQEGFPVEQRVAQTTNRAPVIPQFEQHHGQRESQQKGDNGVHAIEKGMVSGAPTQSCRPMLTTRPRITIG